MVVEFEKEIIRKAKRVFKYKGSIKTCSDLTGLDRTTIPRVLKAGTAEERIVEVLTEYINSKEVA